MRHRSTRPDRSAPRARRIQDELDVGRIVRPHGIRGLLVLESPVDLVARLAPGATLYLGEARVPVVLRSLQLHQSRFLIELEGCTNRTAAESWRGAVVHVREADLAPLSADVHYQREVIGLRVQTEDGEIIGRVERILPSRAHDLYEVRDTEGRSFLLPASKAFVRGIDVEAGVMTVRLVPGLRPD